MKAATPDIGFVPPVNAAPLIVGHEMGLARRKASWPGGGRSDDRRGFSAVGTVVGVGAGLASRLRDAGHSFNFADAASVGHALIVAALGPLRIDVPVPFLMYAELALYWLSAFDHPSPRSCA